MFSPGRRPGVRGSPGGREAPTVEGIWSLEVGILSVEVGIWSLEVGIWSLEVGTWSLEVGIAVTRSLFRGFRGVAWL